MIQINKALNLFSQNVLQSARRNVCIFHILRKKDEPLDIDEIDDGDKNFQQLRNKCFGSSLDHSCYIIHPYVKWGPQKEADTTPQKQMEEAEALIRTLAPWKVHDKTLIPLENLDKKTLFGSGNLEKLKKTVRGDRNITAVFINIGTLQNVQIEELELQFRVPIYDRYRIVMQILRLHAISKHAKLQVALAEIGYMWSRFNSDSSLPPSFNPETKKLMLQSREQKIKSAIKKLRGQRELLRNRRKQEEYPVVAVVGYTNCGKTSLIKSLTGEKTLDPKNQLFATLDVTVHEGSLPSYLQVLYVDTVGFIANIPTSLIECFVATLEDAMFADIIIHVQDISSKDFVHQRNHVLETLKSLAAKTGAIEKLNEIITVNNKSDLVDSVQTDDLAVSAETGLGLGILLNRIEEAVIKSTGRHCIAFRLPCGGDEIRWLYKNATVASATEDENDSQLQKANVIITQAKLEQFKHQFLKKKH